MALFFSFFGLTFFKMDGGKTNLYDLENSIVRPRFKEPRVHFALNCASIGCPQLPPKAFLPETLEAQLAAETEKFLHEPRNVNLQGDKVVLSEIFKWYEEDFPPSPTAWIQGQASDLGLAEGLQVEHNPYDWALNDSTR